MSSVLVGLVGSRQLKKRLKNIVPCYGFFTFFSTFLISWSMLPQLSQFHPQTVDSSANSASNVVSPFTKLLIVRPVSLRESDNVIDDVKQILSYREEKNFLDLKKRSLSNCHILFDPGNDTGGDENQSFDMDPFSIDRQSFPNRLACDPTMFRSPDNNYWSVQVDFLLFARDDTVASKLNASLPNVNKFGRVGSGKIEVEDVSYNPKKTWTLHSRLNEDRLEGYNYVWIMDGDVELSSLNWHAFWQQVKLFKPKICQPTIIGKNRKAMASGHYVLRYKSDSRLIASEGPLIEAMAALLEVDTWLGFRKFIHSDQKLLQEANEGAENCFDMAWCHFARNNMTGVQSGGLKRELTYYEENRALSVTDRFGIDEYFQRRSCVIMHQVPLVHKDLRSMSKTREFVTVQRETCQIFRKKYGVIDRFHLGTVLESFSAPLRNKTGFAL